MVGASMPETASSISLARTLMRWPSVAMSTLAMFASDIDCLRLGQLKLLRCLAVRLGG